MKRFASIVAVLLLFFANSAAWAVTCYSYGCEYVPANVHFDSNGKIFISYSSTPTGLDCTLDVNGNIRVEDTVDGRDMIASVLLTAVRTNTLVFVRINNASNPCTVRYVAVSP